MLNDGFSFSTENDNGIEFYGSSRLVFNGDCAINANINSISGDSFLEIKGDSNSKLTINRGIKVDDYRGETLRIIGGNIRTANVNIISSYAITSLLEADDIFLNNCSIIDNADAWGGGKQSVSSQYLKISRGVTLDLASSTVSGSKGIYIGDISNAENIGDFSDAKNIELKNGDPPYNGNIT